MPELSRTPAEQRSSDDQQEGDTMAVLKPSYVCRDCGQEFAGQPGEAHPACPHGLRWCSGRVVEVRDALDDAIRRAYCQPVRPAVEGEDQETVDMLALTAILTDPDRMRHLAAIQAAAWGVIRQWT